MITNKQPPSPGMSSQRPRGPPSPGGLTPLASSPIISSASQKRRPMPGGGIESQSPEGGNVVKVTRRRAPSPGMTDMTPPRRRAPSPGDMIGRVEPKKFVFSAAETGVVPAEINVSNETVSRDTQDNIKKPVLIPQPLVVEAKDCNDDERDDSEMAPATADEKEERVEQVKDVDESKANKDGINQFSRPAKHWVNLKSTPSININRSDALLEDFTREHSDKSVSSAESDSLKHLSSISSNESDNIRKLTPRKKVLMEKYRDAKERQSLRSSSPKPTRESNQSPTMKIVKPSPIKATGSLFKPITKDIIGDDRSVSSFSTLSFESSGYGGKKNKVSLAQKTRRISSRSPMRYRPFEEKVKTNLNNEKQQIANDSDSLSDQTGISLIKAQKQAVQQMKTFEKPIMNGNEDKPKKSTTRLSSNLARLKALKEEKRLREEEKEQKSRAEEKKKYVEKKSTSRSTTAKTDKEKTPKKRVEKKTVVADDEFTVDCEDMNVSEGPMAASFSYEDGNNKKEKSKQGPKWADVMRKSGKKPGQSSDDESSFQHEFQQGNLWDSPERNNHVPPVGQVNIADNEEGSVEFELKQHHQKQEQQSAYQPPLVTLQQMPGIQSIDINPYIGPFAQLLPRSTNPLIVRTSLPSLSSSLTTTNTIQPPPTSIPGHNITSSNAIQPPPTSIPGHVNEHSVQNSNSIAINSQVVPVSVVEQQENEIDEDVSTLIGQHHLPSNDSMETPGSVSEWWDAKHAGSHDEDINKLVKNALAQMESKRSEVTTESQILEDALDLDSDDDVFSGLDSPRKKQSLKKYDDEESADENRVMTQGKISSKTATLRNGSETNISNHVNQTEFTNDGIYSGTDTKHAMIHGDDIQTNDDKYNERRFHSSSKQLSAQKGEIENFGRQITNSYRNSQAPLGSYDNQIKQAIPDNHYASDSENIAPTSFDSHVDISLAHNASSFSLQSVSSTAYHKNVLDNFCSRIKNTAIEVIKLNRDQKWQPKYLTVSKEGTWLKHNHKDDRSFCPLALLWVKKFNSRSNNEHSVLSIDKQGRGGILLANLVRVEIKESQQGLSSLSRRQQERYRNSCIVNLHGQSSFVTFRAQKAEAESIYVGCNALIELLRGNKKTSVSKLPSHRLLGNVSSRPMMSGRSVVSNVSNGGTSKSSVSTASNNNNQTLSRRYVIKANDLWEA